MTLLILHSFHQGHKSCPCWSSDLVPEL
jgi:hypothetical protein